MKQTWQDYVMGVLANYCSLEILVEGSNVYYEAVSI